MRCCSLSSSLCFCHSGLSFSCRDYCCEKQLSTLSSSILEPKNSLGYCGPEDHRTQSLRLTIPITYLLYKKAITERASVVQRCTTLLFSLFEFLVLSRKCVESDSRVAETGFCRCSTGGCGLQSRILRLLLKYLLGMGVIGYEEGLLS